MAFQFEDEPVISRWTADGISHTLLMTPDGDLALCVDGNSSANRIFFEALNLELRIAGGDNIFGGVGDDQLYGNGDNDVIYGGFGNDRLYGNMGDDRLVGGRGDDRLFGNAGNDRLQGGEGNDLIETAKSAAVSFEFIDHLSDEDNAKDSTLVTQANGHMLVLVGFMNELTSDDFVHGNTVTEII